MNSSIKNYTAVILYIFLIAGLFASRALLSIFPVAAVVCLFLFWNSELKSIFTSSYMLWSIMPIIIGLLGVYQAAGHKDNTQYLLSMCNYVGVAAFITIIASIKAKKILISNMFAVCVIVVCISFIFLIKEVLNGNLLQLYASAGTIKSLMHNDHVRFALFVALILAVQVFKHKEIKFVSKINLLLAVFLVAYAVRTGWVGLGIICVGVLIQHFQYKGNFNELSKGVVISIVAIIFLYFTVPSIKGKWQYQQYDAAIHNQTDSIQQKYSDGTRFKLNKAAQELVFKHGTTAVGWHAVGDSLLASLHRMYKGNTTYRWPFNQILFWLMGGGYVAAILYLMWMVLAIFIVPKTNRLLAMVITAIFMATFFVESTLSLQLGIVQYALFMGICFIREPDDNS